jgi:hypothetical protein
MRRLRLVLVPACVVSGGLILSACGGDSAPEIPITVPTEATTGTGATSSKADFITQADAVCEEANTAIEQFAAAGQGLTEADQIATLRQGVVDQIEALPAPAEDQTTLTQFLDAVRAQVAAGEKIALAQDRGEDTAQFETELATARTDAETAAAAYGFQECGQPISSSGTATGPTSPGDAVAPAEPNPSAPAPAPVAPPADSGGTGGGTGGGTDGDAGGGGSGGAGGGLGPG